MDVVVSYRAPDVYSLERMKTLVDQAVASRPDGLVVSIPEPGLAPAIRRAVRAGIPVVSINSGSDVYKRLGVLAHVGQPEQRAGLEAGRRLARAGVRRALSVDQQAYLQGYWPIAMLAQKARYGLFMAPGDVLPTGPNFVTRADAGKAIE